MTRFRMGGVIAAVAVVLGTGAMLLMLTGDDDGSPSPAAGPSGRYARAQAGLCQARSAAGTGDATGARRAFFNRAHLSLHQLAVETTSRDRVVGERLLRAKDAVERGLRTPGASVVPDLDQLLAAMGDAVTAVGETPIPPCPRGDRP